jgi:hypothetical protein
MEPSFPGPVIGSQDEVSGVEEDGAATGRLGVLERLDRAGEFDQSFFRDSRVAENIRNRSGSDRDLCGWSKLRDHFSRSHPRKHPAGVVTAP